MFGFWPVVKDSAKSGIICVSCDNLQVQLLLITLARNSFDLSRYSILNVRAFCRTLGLTGYSEKMNIYIYITIFLWDFLTLYDVHVALLNWTLLYCFRLKKPSMLRKIHFSNLV